MVSETAAAAAEFATPGIEPRQFELKGISQPLDVRVLRLEVNQDQAAGIS